jgi:ComF family protein
MSLLLDILFPRNCLSCGARSISYFCQPCLDRQQINSFDFSPKVKNPHYQGSLSLFKYNSLIRQLITQLKYDFTTDIIKSLTNISTIALKENFPHLLQHWQENNFIITPIPLHYSRQNWRGFNQSALLAQSLAKKLGLKFSEQLLFRPKKTNIQSHLNNRQSKVKNLQNAFILSSTKIPKNIIIFDDIATTYSTLSSALTTLSINDDLNHCYFLTLAA